jgi:excisionase family DNA binding protein
MKGFPVRNLKYMPRFAQVWNDDEFVQQVAAQLPWFHNCVLLDKVADDNERIWYARAAIHHGWSRAVLVHQIESGLHRRQGKAITNFDRALPPPQSDLAQEVTKDPYNFDFLMLGEEAHERDLERGLLEHLRKFLLELGVGFAFVGSQYPLTVGGEEFRIDLLFYHLRLPSYDPQIAQAQGTMTAEQAAEKLGVSLRTVRELLRTKVLSGTQVIKFAPWRISIEALNADAVVERIQRIRTGNRSGMPRTRDEHTLRLPGM